MKYVLTQFNFWDLCRFFKNENDTFIYKELPEYVENFLKENKVNIQQSDVKPVDATIPNGSYADWPKPVELTPNILIKKYHVDDDNFDMVIASIKPGDELIYKEDLTREIPAGIKATLCNSENAPKERIILTCYKTGSNSDLNEYETNPDVIHYVGNVVNSIKYRRHRLNEYLKRSLKVTTIYKGFVEVKSTLIISDPRGSFPLVKSALENGQKIIYDRTDNWNALYPAIEDYVIEHADTVFCSSQYLFNTTNSENKILLPNAATRWNYTNPTKTKTVVYVGKSTNKTDDELCIKLKKEHPEYKFVSIGTKIPTWDYLPLLPWDVMMSYLDHCEIGVIPLKKEDYFKGQFNLKVWDYLQAKLKVFVTDDYNYSGIKNIYTSFEEAIENEFDTDIKIPYWEEVFDKILEKV